MDNDFYIWNQIKIKLNGLTASVLFKEREIWWCAVGQNIGTEVNGKSLKFSRPVLVFKKLSQHNFLGFPLSTKTKTGTWYVSVTQKRILVTVLLNQIRLYDSRRILGKLGTLDQLDWQKVKTAFLDLLG